MSESTKKAYPRALPHRSPIEQSSEADRWRRRATWLFAGAILILAVAIGAVAFAVMTRPPTETVMATPNVDAPVPEPINPAKLAEPAPKVAESKPKLPEAPKKFAVPPPLKPTVSLKPAAASSQEAFLEALGSLSAAHLYQSYLNIGLLADGVESEAYTAKEAEETLLSIGEMIDQVERQLNKLGKAGLEADDQAAIEQIRAVSGMLRLQAKALQDYWVSGETDKATQYHDARKAAWQGLSKVMQLETN
jgi:hypothetical protein